VDLQSRGPSRQNSDDADRKATSGVAEQASCFGQ